MKKNIGALLLISFITFFSGCAAKTDTITFIKESTARPNTQLASYEIDIGGNVGGASVTAELWEKGTCTESAPVTLNSETSRLSVSLFIDGFGNETEQKSIHVQLDTNEEAGSLLTYFALPQNILGYAFTAYESGEKLKISPDEEFFLCAISFDTGTGVRVVDCRNLMDEPERLGEYSCILVLRAAFTADRISPSAEAAAES